MTKPDTHIEFTKMQAAGNDFIMIDNFDQSLSTQKIIGLTPDLCDRHYGIGADGLIALQPPETDNVDCTMLYRNADGSDAGMCGNGARCLALYAKSKGIGKSKLLFNVHQTVYKAQIEAKNQVIIDFPIEPDIEELTIDEEAILKLYTGTEHIVKQLTANELARDERLIEEGRQLRNRSEFAPSGTNVNFIHPLSKNTLILRTYEKGVEDLTLACGTGAIASALAWHFAQDENESGSFSTIIQNLGGTLQVCFDYNKTEKKYTSITLAGEAHFVFEGRYEI